MGRCAAVVALLALVGCGRSQGEPVNARVTPDLIAPDLEGRPFHLQDQRGNVVLLAFGYTHCPDVCPTTLSTLSTTLGLLGEDAARTRVVFLTVDPRRDTVESLRAYLRAFDPRITGLRLEEPALAETLTGVGAVASIRPTKAKVAGAKNESYAMDHTAGTFLFDTRGKLRFRHAFDTSPATLAKDVRALLEQDPAGAGVVVRSPVARLSPSGMGAIYFSAYNGGGVPERLVSARIVSGPPVTLHETVREGGVARMLERPEGFSIAPGATLELSPGGKHLMVEDAPEGERLSLVLDFARAGPITVEVPVRSTVARQ